MLTNLLSIFRFLLLSQFRHILTWDDWNLLCIAFIYFHSQRIIGAYRIQKWNKDGFTKLQILSNMNQKTEFAKSYKPTNQPKRARIYMKPMDILCFQVSSIYSSLQEAKATRKTAFPCYKIGPAKNHLLFVFLVHAWLLSSQGLSLFKWHPSMHNQCSFCIWKGITKLFIVLPKYNKTESKMDPKIEK